MFYSGQKQIFTFFLTSFLASFFNAARKKLVTLDFYIFMKLSKESGCLYIVTTFKNKKFCIF